MLLARKIREKGFSFRMHSYEYYIRNNKFACILVLNPMWNLVTLYRIDWNLKESEKIINELTKILREIDENIQIQVQ